MSEIERYLRGAVAGLGSPARLARRVRSAHGAGRLNWVLSAGWLLTGLAATGLGLAYLVAAGRVGWRSPACASFLSSSCAPVSAVAGPGAAIAAAVGAALLAGRWLAVRYARLAPLYRGFALAAGLIVALVAVGSGIVGQVPLLPDGVLNQVLDPLPAWGWSRFVGATLLIECLAAAVIFADSRPRQYLSWPHD